MKLLYASRDERKKIKHREYMVTYYHKNPDVIREKNTKWKKQNKETTNANNRKWRKSNPEKVKRMIHNWETENKDKVIAKQNRYREANRDKINKKAREQYYANIGKHKTRANNWKRRNREKCKAYCKEWMKSHPEKNAEYHSKRGRDLGFIPLNSYFKGSHGHHIDKEHVIYIPKELHISNLGHNHSKPETMNKINWVAFQYLLNEITSVNTNIATKWI